MKRARRALGLVLALGFGAAHGQSDYGLTGHFKYRFTGTSNPDNSVFFEAVGASTIDHSADVRLNLGWRRGDWSARADYQVVSFKGDTLEVLRDVLEEGLFLANRVPTDRRRLFDLTSVIAEGDDHFLVQRLDRLWLGRTGQDSTVRVGRQAISWGNGLIYTPMDFFNPFDPAAVDREYKSGDDMIYGQYAFDGGDDLQGVLVFRRDLITEDVATDASTLAFKYHGFRGVNEFDLLVAEHYADQVAAVGGNREIGAAVWRGDLVITHTDDDTIPQFVTSFSHSWTGWGRNMSGVVEYFYNGFGQSNGDYSPEALELNPDLIMRIARGELFTLARHYIAARTTIELTPLLLVTPGLFVNISDGSALFQAVALADVRQDIVLLASLSIPIGPDGTEFGGIPGGESGRFLSTGPGLFLQLAAYF
jgi:hypothetical protein